MQTLEPKINLKTLYETDDSLWLEKIIILLKEQKFYELDLENLIEELEDLGSEKKHAVASLTEQIIRHLLLLEYWTIELERNQIHWRTEIIGFRNQIDERLTTNLHNHLEQELSFIYKRALKYVQSKTNYQVDFPSSCPYSLEQILDSDWFPLS